MPCGGRSPSSLLLVRLFLCPKETDSVVRCSGLSSPPLPTPEGAAPSGLCVFVWISLLPPHSGERCPSASRVASTSVSGGAVVVRPVVGEPSPCVYLWTFRLTIFPCLSVSRLHLYKSVSPLLVSHIPIPTIFMFMIYIY